MSDDWSFRTQSGVARVAGGDLQVERSLPEFLRGWYESNVQSEGWPKGVWNLLAVGLLIWSGWRFASPLVDGVQPGTSEAFAVLVVGLFVVVTSYRFYRDVLSTTRIRLADVERAVIDPGDLTLTLVRADGETNLDLRTDGDVEAAREALALKGVSVEVMPDGADGDPGESDGDVGASSAGDRVTTGREPEWN